MYSATLSLSLLKKINIYAIRNKNLSVLDASSQIIVLKKPEMLTEKLSVRVLTSGNPSPWGFHVRTEDMEEKFNSFELRLAESCAAEDFIPASVCNGLFVVRKGRRRYFRAKLLATRGFPGSGNIISELLGVAEVYYIDYGLVDHVSFGSVMPISEEFARIPAFCIPCHLANLRPREGEDWSSEAIEYFLNAVGGRKCTLIPRGDIEYLRADWPSLPVDLSWEDTAVDGPFGRSRSIEVYMSQKLMSERLAGWKCDFSVPEPFEEEENSTLPIDDMSHLEPVAKWISSQMPTEPCTEFTQIGVTHVDNLGQLHFQLHSKRALAREMCIYFENFYEDSATLTSWKKGQACVAKYKNDRWYRGTIVGEEEPDEYSVLFVDYGFMYKVNVKDTRVPCHYGAVPSLANRAILDGVVPINAQEPTDWELEKLDELYKYLSACRKVAIKFTEEPSKGLPVKAKVRCTEKKADNEVKVISLNKRLVLLNVVKKVNFVDTLKHKAAYRRAAYGV